MERLCTVLAVDPIFGRANLIYAAYLHRGQLAEALAKSDRDLRHCSSDPWICGWLAYVYAVAGQPAQARPALLELERLDRTQHIPAEPLMAVYIGMGRTDEGFRYLEKAYSERSTALSGLKIDPLYDPVRNDPRFQDLLRRVNLEQ